MDISGALAAGGALLLIYLLVAVAVIAIEIWIAYTIIWRAVRRGMREFNASPLANMQRPAQNMRGPRDW